MKEIPRANHLCGASCCSEFVDVHSSRAVKSPDKVTTLFLLITDFVIVILFWFDDWSTGSASALGP